VVGHHDGSTQAKSLGGCQEENTAGEGTAEKTKTLQHGSVPVLQRKKPILVREKDLPPFAI
jgi:hypothetical protein